MNIGRLTEYKTIGYAVIVVLLIGGIVLFNPEMFLQAELEPRPDPEPDPEPIAIYITGLAHSPSLPTPADEVDISCTASGATLVILYYDYTDNPTGEGIRVSMTAGSYSKWYGKIPVMVDGVSVTYWVKASNSDGIKTSSILSYIVSTPSTEPPDPTIYSATFVIYKEIADGWEAVPEGGTLSGRIRIDLTVTSGAEDVNAARISFWKIIDDNWVQQDYVGMYGVTGETGMFRCEYDTIGLENAIYDIRYELIDDGGSTIFEQSLFDGDGPDLGIIDQTSLLLGLVCIVGVGVFVFLFRKHWK